MQKTVYTWNGSSYDTQTVTWYSLFECKNQLNRTGNPEDATLQVMANAYIGYDPSNDLIGQWLISSPDDKAALEADNPWLADPATRPADDPLIRESEIQSMINDWGWRRFKASRTKAVASIIVTRDSDGMQFDGDEASQARMGRIVTLGNARVVSELKAALQAAEANPALSVQELATSLIQAIDTALSTASNPWKTASNGVDSLNYYEAEELCTKAGQEQTAVWFE